MDVVVSITRGGYSAGSSGIVVIVLGPKLNVLVDCERFMLSLIFGFLILIGGFLDLFA